MLRPRRRRRPLPLFCLPTHPTRPNSTSAAADPPPYATDAPDNQARCFALLPGLLRRGNVASALSIITRIIHRSSILDAISAARYAASLDLPLNHGRLLGTLVASGQLSKADALFTDPTTAVSRSDSSVLNSMIVCYSKLGALGAARTQLARLFKFKEPPCEAACSALLHSLCAKDRNLSARSLLLWMVSSGMHPRASAYNLLIPGLCSNGRLDEGRHVFDVMLGSGMRPTIHLYKSLVYGFCRGNRVVEAERVLGDMEAHGFFPDLPMYTSVMQGYCRDGKMEAAVRLFDRMGKHDGCCKPDASVYSRLIYGFMKQSEFDAVGSLFVEMVHRGFIPDGRLRCDIVNWYCRNRKVDNASILVDMMLKHGLVLELSLYIDVIVALCNESRVDQADRWFDKMLDCDLIPDNEAFASLIKNYPMGREPDIVCKILLAMEKVGCKIDVSLFSKVCSGENLLSQAELLFGTIVGNTRVPADVALNILIHALCINGKAELALFLLEKMVNHGCEISTFTFNAVIRCLGKERSLKNPEFFISLADSWSVKPNISTYLILIDACCKHGNIKSATGFYEQMIERGFRPSVAIFDSMIGYFCREKRLGDAEHMFEKMFKEGVKPDEVVYTTLLNGYSKRGRAIDACNIYCKMKKDGFQVSLHAYSSLINGLMKKNMFNKACQFLSEMLKQGYVPDTVLYTMLINQFGKKGMIDFSFSLYNSMIRYQIEPNILTFGALITGACKSIPRWGRVPEGIQHPLLNRKLKEAICMLSMLLPEGTAMRKINQRIPFRSLEEKIKEAYGILRFINDNKTTPDLYVYNSMMKFYCTLRGIDDALDVVDLMLSSGFHPNHVTYTILINACIRAGEIDHGIEFFNLMNKEGCIPDEVTYDTLIKGLCIAGRGIDALSLVYMMRKRGHIPDKISYDKLVECLYSGYSSELACAIFEEMLSCNYVPRRKTLNCLLWILCEERKLFEAYKILDAVLKRGRSPDGETKKQLVEACYREKEFELGFLMEKNVLITEE